MGFLNPLFLLAAAAVAVPLVLHLFHRHDRRRVAFPALRYLLRTEKEHARRIRLRQLLLLLLRVGAVLLLVLAGARLVLPTGGGSHEPTALAIVLDNSLSSGRLVGEERVLDRLKRRAREVLARAEADDRIWVVRAGEPWDPALPLAPDAALRRVEETGPVDARGDLVAALARARTLVTGQELPASEIHLLSDLQATAFASPLRTGEPPAGEVPVVTWTGEAAEAGAGANRYLREVRVGGGLPPLAGQRTEISVGLAASGPAADTSPAPVRVVIGDRIRAAGTVRPGNDAVLPVGPFGAAPVEGWVETDPDDLRADDRRWFAFEVRPPVPVVVGGTPTFFQEQALAVLEGAGRVRRGGGEGAVLLSAGGAGLEGWDGPAVILPPVEPTLLPGLNRRLATAGIPWRYDAPGAEGEAAISESRLPSELEGITVRRVYGLRPEGDAPPAADVPARLATGEPLLVSGLRPGGRYLLLGVPLDPAWSDLPVSAGMVPLLEWAVARWAFAGGSGAPRLAGEPIPVGPEATAVETPDGTRLPVGGTRSFPATGRAGLYRVLAGDSLVETVAVNPSARESELAAAGDDALPRLVGPGVVAAADPGAWSRAVFQARRGSEVWRTLLILAAAFLLLESWLAAAGRRPARSGGSGAGAGSSGTPGAPGRTRVGSVETVMDEHDRARAAQAGYDAR